MIKVRKTKAFERWLEALRDFDAQDRIRQRLMRLSKGNFGSHRVLAGGIGELKIDCGAGYRVYYLHCGKAEVLLLRGGDKRTQRDDIDAARTAARQARPWR